MTPKAWILNVSLAFAALAPKSWAQSPNWRVYRLADGLPESACVSVAISPQGKVLGKHLNLPAISQLDGYGTKIIPAPELVNSRVYGSPGGQLWTLVPEGLLELRDQGWLVQPVPELAAEFRANPPPVDGLPLWPVKQGVVLFLLPQRLMRFTSEDLDRPRTELLRAAEETRLERFIGLGNARDGGLWISGTRGLAKVPGPIRALRAQDSWQEYLVPVELEIEALQEPHEAEDGMVTAVCELSKTHQKGIAQFDGQHWTICPGKGEKIRHAWSGPEKPVGQRQSIRCFAVRQAGWLSAMKFPRASTTIWRSNPAEYFGWRLPTGSIGTHRRLGAAH